MTERQKRFVAEVAKHGNATKAALSAGYAKSRAKAQGSELLQHPEVRAALDELRAPVLEAAQVTLAGHLQELADIRDAAKAEGQFSAAAAAETNRGKVAGFYTERHQHEHAGAGGGPLRVEVIHTIVDPDAG